MRPRAQVDAQPLAEEAEEVVKIVGWFELRIIAKFVSQAQLYGNFGRAYSHRIPLVKLNCLSEKRLRELVARRRGEEPGDERRVELLRHGRSRSLFRLGTRDV